MDRPSVIHALPFFFGPEQQLFGWFHQAHGDVARATAVVLCPPLGYEYVTSYRAYRHLAERLAAIGFPVLRVEYYAMGNSAGSVDDDHQVSRWTDSIETAVAELKERSGCAHVALAGMRMGALLAALVASKRDDVHGLVLWEPCASGRHYVRQLQMLAMSHERVEELDADAGLESAGFRFSRATVADISALQLMKLTIPAQATTLLITRDDQATDRTLAAHLERCGVKVTEQTFEGYASMMMVPTHEADVPEQVLKDIVTWFGSLDPGSHGHKSVRSVSPQGASAGLVAQRTLRTALGNGQLVQETAVRFGDGLFGILTASKVRDSSRPAVILLNTGADHHIGQHGMYVPLARDWAAQGFGVLRFDLAGLGASPVRAGEVESSPFATKGDDDIVAAVNFVKERGYERVVLIGVCSGGYNAVHAASRGAPVSGIIAINAALQFKPRAITLDPVWNKIEMDVLSKNLVSPKKWARFFTGKIRYRYVLGIVVNRLRLFGRGALPAGLRARLMPEADEAKTADVASLVTPGIQTHFIFSRGDPGHSYFEVAIGNGLSSLTARNGFSMEVLDDADHNFMSGRLQKRLVALLTHALLKHVDGARPSDGAADVALGRAQIG